MKTAILFLCLCSVALADDITIDGTTYQDFRFGAIRGTTVTIFHKTGVASVPVASLPPETQKKLGYDPVKAQAAIEQAVKARIEAERLRQQELSKPIPEMISGTVIQVEKNGLLIQPADTGLGWHQVAELDNRTGMTSYHPEPNEPIHHLPVFLTIDPTGYVDGQDVRLNGVPSGTVSYTGVDGAMHTVKHYAKFAETTPAQSATEPSGR
jgi:hypothetical protein